MRCILGSIFLDPKRWTPFKDPGVDLIELLPRIREAGFEKIEVWQWHVTSRCLAAVRAMKERGDELGITFPYIGVYPWFIREGVDWREQERLLADVLDKAEILGTKTLKVMFGVGLRGGDATAEQKRLTVERFGKWYQEAKSRGIGMCIELHGGTMFDPVEVGEGIMREHPELDFSICYQPFDFTDTEGAMALADRFAGKISHIHLQNLQPSPEGPVYAYLDEGTLDYTRLLPYVVSKNPEATMTIEFVKRCIQQNGPFDVELVLEDAKRDGAFVERVLGILDFGLRG